MPIKSVHITNYYHKNSGGISTAYNAILAAAGRHKRYATLIAPGEKHETEMVNDYAKIIYIEAPKSALFDKRYRLLMPWHYMPTHSVLKKVIIGEDPDMIEVRDKYALSLFGLMVRRGKFKDLKKRPLLVSFSSERMDDNVASFLFDGKFPKWFAKRVMGNYNFPGYDFHIANSPYTADEFFRSTLKTDNPRRKDWFLNFCWRFIRSPRIPIKERVRICPSGVNEKQFSPRRKSAEVRSEMAKKAGIPENAAILLYAGRISPEKNVKLLPDFMEVLGKDKARDYRLLVAGAGPQAEWLKKETDKRIPGKIIQIGHLDKETLANYYATADVFIHPNPKEPFGIGPLEAMASGVPTVVPNSGGLLFYATNENCWLVEPTAENFANAVKEIFENPNLREKKIQKAFDAVKENTHEKFTERLFDTYDRLYEDFQARNELFTDVAAAKKFDYTSLLK